MAKDTPEGRQGNALVGLKGGLVRGIWRHSAVDWTEAAKLADSLNLSEHRARRLYLHLCRARSIYDGWNDIYLTPRNSAVAARLKEIEKSIVRIAGEAQATDKQFEAARSVLGQEGERWAAGRDPIELQRLGFCTRALGTKTLYGAADVIERWFRTAPFILYALRQARSRLKEKEDLADQWGNEPGQKEWLVGKRLPELYKQVSGDAFGISKISDQVQSTGGIAFVITAHRAIGLGSISPATVASHVKNHNRRTAAGG